MDAKQYAWVYLIDHGQPGKPSCYGGTEYPNEWIKRFKAKGWDQYGPIYNGLIKEIKKVGVDWDKTQEPRSNLVSRFTDTFHDSAEEECLMGTLILRDGSEQEWYADSVKITNVFEMLAMAETIPGRFKEIFG